MTSVSIVVPTAGKWSRLQKMLRSLEGQDCPTVQSWDIVLVLDGVQMPKELELSLIDKVQVVQLDAPCGRATARNMGARAASGEIVIFLDDDIIALPELVVAHASIQAQEPCLCRGSVRELPALSFFPDLNALDDARSNQMLRRRVKRILLELDDDLEASWVKHGRMSRIQRDGTAAFEAKNMVFAWIAFAGANLSAPRTWILEHPFDERAGTAWGVEDLSLALRWLLNGQLLRFAPQARAFHLSHPQPRWRESLRSTRVCLDFLAPESVDIILDYLEGTREHQDVTACIAPLLKSNVELPNI